MEFFGTPILNNPDWLANVHDCSTNPCNGALLSYAFYHPEGHDILREGQRKLFGVKYNQYTKAEALKSQYEVIEERRSQEVQNVVRSDKGDYTEGEGGGRTWT